MGFHRIYLRAQDGDHLTVYVPLADDGRLDPRGHAPWLLKAVWGGFTYLGELELGVGNLNRVVWASGDEDSVTDFGTAVIRKGALVAFHESDINSQKFGFTVVDVQRV